MRRITGAVALSIALLVGGPALAEPPQQSETPQTCLESERQPAAGCAEAQGEATPPTTQVAAIGQGLQLFTPPPRGNENARTGGVERPGRRL